MKNRANGMVKINEQLKTAKPNPSANKNYSFLQQNYCDQFRIKD